MKTCFFIDDNGRVEIQFQENGVTTVKETTLKALGELFIEAVKEPPPPEPDKWLITPALPSKTVAFKQSDKGHFRLVMDWGPDVLQFQYEDTLFQAIPFPRLLFAFKGYKEDQKFKLQGISVVAVKTSGIIMDTTPLYRYPYSHVDSNTNMCYGYNELPLCSHLTNMQFLPREVLTTPNGTHHYNNQTNLSGMVLRQLLETLNGKKEFPKKYLAPLGFNFSEWLSKIN